MRRREAAIPRTDRYVEGAGHSCFMQKPLCCFGGYQGWRACARSLIARFSHLKLFPETLSIQSVPIGSFMTIISDSKSNQQVDANYPADDRCTICRVRSEKRRLTADYNTIVSLNIIGPPRRSVIEA